MFASSANASDLKEKNIPPAFSAIEANEKVAGQDLSVWIQRYWKWVRSFPKEQSPTDDKVGTRSSFKQKQPVFFLTGSNSPKSVTRYCNVPRGQYVFIPVINALIQATAQKPCEDLLSPLSSVNESVSGLSIMVNGKPVDQKYIIKEGSGCFELNDISSGISGKAAGAGYWVILKPLDPGDYEIHFTGVYNADGFSQNVKYDLRVE